MKMNEPCKWTIEQSFAFLFNDIISLKINLAKKLWRFDFGLNEKLFLTFNKQKIGRK